MKTSHLEPKPIPSLAGLATMEQAGKPGLPVEECVRRLKRLHYAFKRLHQIFIDRLTSEPNYELKMAFSLHSYLCAEQVSALRKRVGEMREPPLGLDVVPDANVEIFFDEILCAPTTAELVSGIYEIALPAIRDELETHIEHTNPLADHPSVRLCRHALLDIDDIQQFGKRAVEALTNASGRERCKPWFALLRDCLQAAGGLAGKEPVIAKDVVRQHSAMPHKYDPVPRRDERFPDPYNMGVNAEVFLYDERFSPQAKTLMLYFKRLREIDVPEMMAGIIAETPGKPWAYYRDMTRQLWDEARHAMMGEVGFAMLGLDWPRLAMVNFTWSLALNTQLKPIERHAVLYFIEQGLMPRNGKRFEWELGVASKDPLAALFQDYDWADEVLHARIGRDWYLKEFENAPEGVRYGDECWSRVLVNWEKWRAEGFTGHRNWWPDLYREACRLRNCDPEPEVLSFNVSYQSIRPDLKTVSGSA